MLRVNRTAARGTPVRNTVLGGFFALARGLLSRCFAGPGGAGNRSTGSSFKVNCRASRPNHGNNGDKINAPRGTKIAADSYRLKFSCSTSGRGGCDTIDGEDNNVLRTG